MAFFMVMYALSRVDSAKFKALAGSLTSAFNNPMTSIMALGSSPGDRLAILPKNSKAEGDGGRSKHKNIERMRQEFKQLVEDKKLGAAVQVVTNSEGDRLVIRLSDALMFEPGSADLSDGAKGLMDQVAPILIEAGKPVRIEGHTDNIPIQRGAFPSNWHLSTARATSVLVYLVNEKRLPPELLSPGGYGEYRPIADNNTPEGRAKNRRVEFIILETQEDKAQEEDAEVPASDEHDDTDVDELLKLVS